MYYQSSARPNDPSESETDRLKTLLDNLNNLRGKLKNFTVIDELGQPIGEISDLILDAGHQLNLVISQPDEQGQPPSVLLNGRRIRKVSVQTQSVFVDITKADVRFLPEYLLPDAETPVQPSIPVEDSLSVASPTASTTPTTAPPVTLVPPTPVSEPSPDFSLDVMESPVEGGSSSSDDFLTEVGLEPDAIASTSQPQDDLDFLELSEKPQEEISFAGLSDNELPELELPNEARSLDEFSLTDSLDFGADSDLESTDIEPLAENYTLAELDATSAASEEDEWAEFEEMMGDESTETTSSFDFDAALDEAILDADPLPEAFTLSELESASDRPAQPLPELTLDDASGNAESLIIEDTDTTEAFDLEPTEGVIDLDLMAEEEPLPDLTLTETEDLSPLDLTAEEDAFAGLDLESDLTSLDSTAEADAFAGLGLDSGDSLASLDFTTEEEDFAGLDLGGSDNLSELSLGADTEFADDELATSLPDLDLAEVTSQPDDLLDLDLGEEPSATTSSDLDFDLEAGEPSDAFGDELISLEQPSAPSISGLDNLDFGDTDEQPQDEPGFAGFDFATLSDTSEPLPELNLEPEPLLTEEPSEDADAIAFIEENELLDLDLDDLNAEPGVGSIEPIASSPDTISSLAELDFADDTTTSLELEPEPETTSFELTDSLELETPADDETTLDLSDFGASLDESSAGLNFELDEATELDALALADVSPEPTAGFVEPPPALNLDDLELSSIPLDLPETLTTAEADVSTPESSLAPEADIARPEFGLESVPALTYDLPDSSSQATPPPATTAPAPDAVDAIVPLLEERLQVEYDRRKVGEVIIRKRIETRMVQVPVRYETLVIEQVGGEKPLAEVDLSQGSLDELEIPEVAGRPLVSSEFKSAKTASYVLDAIAKTLRHRCKNVRIEIELDDPKLQQAYQDWLNQCSQM